MRNIFSKICYNPPFYIFRYFYEIARDTSFNLFNVAPTFNNKFIKKNGGGVGVESRPAFKETVIYYIMDDDVQDNFS